MPPYQDMTIPNKRQSEEEVDKTVSSPASIDHTEAEAPQNDRVSSMQYCKDNDEKSSLICSLLSDIRTHEVPTVSHSMIEKVPTVRQNDDSQSLQDNDNIRDSFLYYSNNKRRLEYLLGRELPQMLNEEPIARKKRISFELDPFYMISTEMLDELDDSFVELNDMIDEF
mmetsp:Transcript_21499/g.36931  ORF Transcript_21499/g.36931 Transcript_21499/m.36931 type:complete len:169 (+) Transcript_21499:147-653(+)|eukprot:CAMPEP_0183751874 /NCGR_PEP_ID=MMETSP0739-20130205/2008_1 /TAXON_ID=385413 /ORGANISM="Thalassiosira miniscula, Strain CCMP1093" /LENGTH=168 /DNA_ID=CAMNT_0025988163 /DNA_START=70 /DNA_END=576 /DNA_ORIENTATION=-